MKHSHCLSALALFALTPLAYAEPATESAKTPSSEQLIGTWDVSLYFSKDAPPSGTTLIVTTAEGGNLEGSFYGSAFSESGVTVFNDEIIFTAVTADGSGPYLHSGRLSQTEDIIEGQTLSTGRDFLMAWTAERQTVETD